MGWGYGGGRLGLWGGGWEYCKYAATPIINLIPLDKPLKTS